MSLSKPCLDHADKSISRDWHPNNNNNNNNQIESPSDQFELRALIHAYGSDNRNVNINRPCSMPWRNTEEEEFDWQHISAPTSGTDCGTRDGFLHPSKSSSTSSKRPRTGFVAPRSTTRLESDIRNGWSGQSKLPAREDSSIVSKDAVPSLGFARGSPGNMNGQKNHNLLSSPPHKHPCKMPRRPSKPLQTINSFGRGMKGCFNSRMVSSYNDYNINADARSVVVPASVGLRPPVHANGSHPPPHFHPVMPTQNQKVQSHDFINSSNTVNQQNQMQPPLQPPILTTQEGQMHHIPGMAAPLPPNPMIPNNTSLQATLPPNNADTSVSSLQPASALSGLLNSLMAQGLISLPNPKPVQESLGLEFNADLLKVRHGSVIKALYDDLPRQCTTCGRRFKSQEEHRSHMDWHVTQNRMSKNQKIQSPSRMWLASASLWLSSATDADNVFLPAETILEKRSDEEMAVPADEDEKVCALCGDAFEEFYSDETEEWMFKGAVYLNAVNGSTAGMDRAQLGSAVHVKCRSGSSMVP